MGAMLLGSIPNAGLKIGGDSFASVLVSHDAGSHEESGNCEFLFLAGTRPKI